MTPTTTNPAIPKTEANGQPLPELPPEVIPNYDEIVVQDDAPMDSIYNEKQQRLLTEPLYSAWPGPGEGRTFMALANVGFFYQLHHSPIVPDTMLALDTPPIWHPRQKENRSYFIWEIGKSPEVALEIVSDVRGGEDGEKKDTYARVGVLVYVIYDPDNVLKKGVLRAFVLDRRRYVPIDPKWFEEIGLGLTTWTGEYERQQESWLRWCDRDGKPIPSGAECAEQLREQLRRLGHEPQV